MPSYASASSDLCLRTLRAPKYAPCTSEGDSKYVHSLRHSTECRTSRRFPLDGGSDLREGRIGEVRPGGREVPQFTYHAYMSVRGQSEEPGVYSLQMSADVTGTDAFLRAASCACLRSILVVASTSAANVFAVAIARPRGPESAHPATHASYALSVSESCCSQTCSKRTISMTVSGAQKRRTLCDSCVATSCGLRRSLFTRGMITFPRIFVSTNPVM